MNKKLKSKSKAPKRISGGWRRAVKFVIQKQMAEYRREFARLANEDASMKGEEPLPVILEVKQDELITRLDTLEKALVALMKVK